MADQGLPADLDITLLALADPTRRAILSRLVDGELRVTELAKPFAMTLNAVSKHIRVLERACLVRRRRAGREHVLSLNPGGLDQAASWIEAQRTLWTARLDALDEMLRAEHQSVEPEPQKERPTTMSAESTVVLRVSRHFQASPERVFDAWLDPEKARRWLFATPTGQMVRVEIDARVGGSFVFTDRRDGEDIDHIGQYLEIDRPRRLVFTFSVPKFSSLSTRVIIEIASAGSGCELTLTHEGVLPEFASRGEEGWTKLLESLASVAAE